MKPTAFAAVVALLAVSCTVQKKEDPAASDSAAAAAAAATTPVVLLAAPPAPKSAVVTDSARTAGKASPKKGASKAPTVGGERDSATEPVLEIGADGKVRPVKK